MFAAATGVCPDRTAVEHRSVALSYAQLAAAARTAAEQLRECGVRPGSAAALGELSGVGLYVALLALWSMDCTPVPLYSGGAGEEDRAIRVGASYLIVAVGPDGNGVVCKELAGAEPDVDRPAGAYVVSTSGSTSRPKDVRISDRNLRARASHVGGRKDIPQGARIAQNAQPTFDLFYDNLVMAWLFHGTLILPDKREHILIDRFVADRNIQVWFGVPSQARMAAQLGCLRPGAMPDLRLAIFGGEALPADLVRRWRESAPRAVIVNAYGPSEMTIACSEYTLQPEDPIPEHDGFLPIGRCYDPVASYLLPRPEDPGVAELYVGGEQLFDGYEDSAHDEGRFFRIEAQQPIPVPPTAPDRWYRTGDLFKDTIDGLVFQARVGAETKVLGRRIDLEEVRRVLEADDRIGAAWVTVLDDAVQAAVEGVESADPIDVSALRPYARPRQVAWMSELPHLANGKVDLQALRELLGRAGAR